MTNLKTKIILASVVVVTALVVALLWRPGDKSAASADGAKALFVYCAAGLRPAVDRIAQEYEQQYGVPIQLQYAGSGTLLANIRAARTGDLYIAADNSYLELGRAQGLLAEAIPLCSMRPALAFAKGNPKRIASAADLTRADVRVSLSNPDAASIGRMTREFLQSTGQWAAVEQAVSARGVFHGTVTEVANDIKLGTVDAGVIWDSTLPLYPELDAAPLTDDPKFASDVPVCLLTCSRRPTDALRFARYLAARDRGAKVFAELGYRAVEGDVWEVKPELQLLSGGVNRVAIEDTIQAFEQREGVTVTRVYNGCGILVAQMKAGERPDAYLACDVSFVPPVQDLFLDSTDVSETDVVIATQKGNPRGIASLADLAQPGLKIGVGNPQQSTLGTLTETLLASLGLLDGVMKNVVSQTPTADLLVNQLRTETLDAVVVYDVNVALIREHVHVIRVDHPLARAVQPYAVGRESKHKQLAGRLLDAIRSPESQQRYRQLGFRLAGVAAARAESGLAP